MNTDASELPVNESESTTIMEHVRSLEEPREEPESPRKDAEAPVTREPATGKFIKRSHNSKATPDDVQSINELTGRIKTAEERFGTTIARQDGESERVFQLRRRAEVLGQLDAAQQATSRVQQLERQLEEARRAGTPQQVQRAEAAVAKIGGDATDARPSVDDEKYGGDWDKYLDDLTRYNARQEWKRLDEERTVQQARQEKERTFTDRVASARQKHQDFDAKANGVMAKIPPKSVVEEFFFRHKAGEDVVVYLHDHPQELDALLRMDDPYEQVGTLSQIALRTASSHSGQAGSTTAAAESKFKQPPKPPTVVRSEAQRTTDDPPLDGSLSITAHAKAFRHRH